MKSIALNDGVLEWRGSEWLEMSEHGVAPKRISASYLAQLEGISLRRVSATSGIRVAFRSNTSAIEIDCTLRSLSIDEAVEDPAIDVVVDGMIQASAGGVEIGDQPSDVDLTRLRFRFDELGSQTRSIEVWLPHDAIVTVESISVDDVALVERSQVDGRRVWVHHGSSISHCGEAESPARTWPANVSFQTGMRLTNLATPGECQLDQFMARSIRDHKADLISLELGVNVVNGATMLERTFKSALHGFLDTIRDGHPQTPIVVMSPILFPTAEARPGPTPCFDGEFIAAGDPKAEGALSIEAVRNIIDQVIGDRTDQGDTNLSYISGLRLLGQDDADRLSDGLHPDQKGYDLIAERFVTEVGLESRTVPAH